MFQTTPAVVSLGFTASRTFPVSAERVASDWLSKLSRSLELESVRPRFVTGGARGGDAYIGHWLAVYWGHDADHVVVLPANRAQVDPWWERLPAEWWTGRHGKGFRSRVELIEMPPGSSYEDRNWRIVVEAPDGVHAFPQHLDRRLDRRSGTHQTIRLAREAGRLGEVTPVAG
jgi:hypothetical protein